MKRILFSALILLISTTTALAIEKGEICVSRREDNGALNLRAAQITANGEHLFWITGGERKCIEVWPGEYRIVAQSSDPYNPNDKNPATWKSKPPTVRVQEGGKAVIFVAPVSQGATYIGPWELKQ
jgi:hypothetical protein